MRRSNFFSSVLLFGLTILINPYRLLSTDTSLGTALLDAAYAVESSWNEGYVAKMTLTNNSAATVSSWKATISLNAGQVVDSVWSGKIVGQNSSPVTIVNEAWNGTLAPRQSISFGYQVSNPQRTATSPVSVQAVGSGLATPSGTPFALNASFVIDNQWTTGYQVTVTVKNNSAQPSSSWQATFQLPAGYAVTSVWNGVGTTSGTTVTVKNPQWAGGGTISAGGSTTFGMTISKPANSASVVNGLTAVANGTGVVPDPNPNPTPPQAPVMQPINNSSNVNHFQVAWSFVANVQGYRLQQSLDAQFTNYTTVFEGTGTTTLVSVNAPGVYYYRVIAFSENLNSAPSNVVSTTVHEELPHGPYIIDGYWESWRNAEDPIDAIVNMKVDVINISFANFRTTGLHQYEIAGVECDQVTLQQLVAAAHALNKKVKIAVGGATYPLQPQLQTAQDALGMAQAVARYVANNSLDGVDWDIEDYPRDDLQVELLKQTRLLMPNKLITYTPKSPASTTYPYNDVIRKGHQYFDYLSIMAYDYAPGYRYQDDVQALLAMGVPASKIIVGLMPGVDDLGVMTSVADITTAAQFIKQNNLLGIMFWDLNRDLMNVTGLGKSAATNAVWNVFNAH